MDHEVEELARLSILEEELSVLRHDLRNRLNGIRNGAYYLKQKSSKTELWESDERVPVFFELIDDEIGKAEESLAQQASVDHVLARQLEDQTLEIGVTRALRMMAVPAHISLETDFGQEATTSVCEVEVALFARCLVENSIEALEGRDSGSICVSTRSDLDGRARLCVEDDGPGLASNEIAAAIQSFRTEKPGHRGLGLNIARRIAQRYSGKLDFQTLDAGGVSVGATFS